MDFYGDVLKRAEKEGKIDRKLLPWEGSRSTSEIDDVDKRNRGECSMPFELKMFPDEVLNDFQRVIENICSLAKEKGLKVIGLASAVPDQGNSTLSALLALMMARRENGYIEPVPSGSADISSRKMEFSEYHKVLLIDAQVRHASIHKMFNVTNEDGLCELLDDGLSLQEVTKEIESSNLRLINAGSNRGFQFLQAHFDKFKSLLDKSRAQFEFVFLDLPSILQNAEGITLSKLCDGVVLVVRAGQTRQEVVQETIRLLESVNVPVIGAILNKRKFYIPEWVYRRL